MLLLGGGPGQAMVEPYLTGRQLRQQAAVGRTIIVFDQRGVDSSGPVLECPELPASTFRVVAAGELDAALDVSGACRDRLAGQGVDLEAYNHLANAHDEVVRRARATTIPTCVASVEHHSERQFSRVFSQQIGITPAAYIERVRVDAACHLLETTQHPVADIARTCGFGSTETMIRTFRRRLDTTPSDHRHHFGSHERAAAPPRS